MWDLVFWKNDNTVNYVPSCWGNSSKTLYKFPKYTNENLVRKYIYDCKDLFSDFDWHPAEAKKIGIKTLAEARKLCLKGQYTSGLDSDDNDEECRKTKSGRVSKKRVFSSSSESELSVTEEGQPAKRSNYEKKYVTDRVIILK